MTTQFYTLSVSTWQEHLAVSWLHHRRDVLSNQVQPAGTQDYCNTANDKIRWLKNNYHDSLNLTLYLSTSVLMDISRWTCVNQFLHSFLHNRLFVEQVTEVYLQASCLSSSQQCHGTQRTWLHIISQSSGWNRSIHAHHIDCRTVYYQHANTYACNLTRWQHHWRLQRYNSWQLVR